MASGELVFLEFDFAERINRVGRGLTPPLADTRDLLEEFLCLRKIAKREIGLRPAECEILQLAGGVSAVDAAIEEIQRLVVITGVEGDFAKAVVGVVDDRALRVLVEEHAEERSGLFELALCQQVVTHVGEESGAEYLGLKLGNLLEEVRTELPASFASGPVPPSRKVRALLRYRS